MLPMFQKRRIKTILHTHELEGMLAGMSAKRAGHLAQLPDHIIAASMRAARVMQTLGRTNRMTTIYSPILYEKFTASARNVPEKVAGKKAAFTWLMAGAPEPNKNPVRFVEIARRYLSKRKNDQFIWLGGIDTGYSAYAQALAREYGLADRISWVKPKDHEDYLNRFSAAHGIVITSDVESLSLIAIEALAMGKPVVSFDNGGTGEILARKYGVLIPRYDIEQCVSKMVQIAEGRLRFRPEELRKRAQDFDVSRVKGPWLKILKSVADS
jgi:glycosyltransferase involved in cell wall biosynthesis